MKSIRVDEIEKYIHIKKKVTLNELSKVFNVSINTIRRDIKYLLNKNSIKKVYGGVQSLENLYSEDLYLKDYYNRKQNNINIKSSIAKKASTLIEDGDTIFVDSGTTTQSIIDNLSSNIKLKLVTNSLDVINKASVYPNVEIIVPGALFKVKTQSFVNFNSKFNIIDMLNIDKCFMAATSVSKNYGVMNATEYEYEIKQSVLKRSKNKILLVDNSKFDKTSFITYANIYDFNVLITNDCPLEYKELLYKQSVELIEI